MQELYHFLKNQKQNDVDMAGWKSYVSLATPQQKSGNNNCALFTIAGCEIISSGGNIRMIDGDKLELCGRIKLAWQCLGESHQSGK
jgi:hypothetical protein